MGDRRGEVEEVRRYSQDKDNFGKERKEGRKEY